MLTGIVEKDGKEFEKLRQQFEDAKKAFSIQWGKVREELERKLKKIDVPPQADEKELAKVPAWLEELIQKKVAGLNYILTPFPQVKFDLKAKRLETLALGLAFKC